MISGAYFGDKMSPLSETTILVPSLVGGVTTGQHIRAMIWTTGPAFAHRAGDLPHHQPDATDVAASAANIDAARATLGAGHSTSRVICLLPLVLLVVFSVIKFPAFLSIFLTAIFSGVLAAFTQHDLVIRFADDPDLSAAAGAHQGDLRGDGDRVRLHDRHRGDRHALLRRRHERHA